MKPIDAGKYKRRITIERDMPGVGNLGQPAPNWVAVRTIHAEIIPGGGREFAAYKAQYSTSTHVVKFRYQGPGFTISAADRINYGGRILNILSASNLEESMREYVVVCEEAS